MKNKVIAVRCSETSINQIGNKSANSKLLGYINNTISFGCGLYLGQLIPPMANICSVFMLTRVIQSPIDNILKSILTGFNYGLSFGAAINVHHLTSNNSPPIFPTRPPEYSV